MMSEITIELRCDFEQWHRYNVYLMAVTHGRQGSEAAFDNLISIGKNKEKRPSITLKTQPCTHAEIYLYIVPNTLPEGDVKQNPPFHASLKIEKDTHTLSINQFGGLTAKIKY